MKRSDFAEAFIIQMGFPLTNNHVLAMLAWQAGENTKAMHNPLATTIKWPRTSDFNTAGVKNFATFEDGLWASIATFAKPYYDATRPVFERKDATDIELVNAIASSPWGTGQAAVNALQAVRLDPVKYATLDAGGQNGL